MNYGISNVHAVRDVTDLIGIRTLVLRQFWAVSGVTSQTDLDAMRPDAPNPPGNMMLMGIQTMKERGRYATLWTYQGVNGSGSEITFKRRGESIDYGFDPGFAQVPIQVHPNFNQLLSAYEGYPSNDGTTVIWPPELSGGKGGSGSGTSKNQKSDALPNPMYGIQAFFEMEGVYRYRYAEKSLPKTLANGVGYIADEVPGDPPSLKDGRNWLKAPAAYQRKGYIYDITEFYWLSRRGGWPRPVYGKGSGSDSSKFTPMGGSGLNASMVFSGGLIR